MVGGSTRMPKVQQIAKEIFQTDQLDQSSTPMKSWRLAPRFRAAC